MRIHANENVPRLLVIRLREESHDVTWAAEDEPSLKDPQVLERARRESRVLLTFDQDFGELAFRSRLPAPCGIVLIRVPALSPEAITQTVASSLKSRDDWAGHFSVIEPGRVRMTPLPAD